MNGTPALPPFALAAVALVAAAFAPSLARALAAELERRARERTTRAFGSNAALGRRSGAAARDAGEAER